MSEIAALVSDHLNIWTTATERKNGAGRGGGKRVSFYGIERLRALILDLALRGRLVPQIASDEPASDLMKRVGEDRAALGAKLSKAEAVALPPDLPRGWVALRLADLANPQAGFAFKSVGFNELGVGLPLIRIRDVGQPFTGTFFSGAYRNEFVVQEGDYLISMDGEFRVAAWDRPEALLNQRVSRLQFYGDEVVRPFVAMALQAELTKLQGVKAYTTVDHLSGKQIAGSLILLPPLAEQRRIVAKVNKLMALCDALEGESAAALAAHQTMVETLLATLVDSVDTANLTANWSRLEAHFDTLFTTEASVDALKQTILDLAVRGRLVPQIAGEGTGLALLETVKKARRATGVKAWFPKSCRHSEDLLPYRDELPKSWTVARLGEITTQITDGTHFTPTYQPTGVAFISVKDIDGRTVSFKDCKFIDELEHIQLNARCNPQLNDILLCRIGTLGRPTIVDTDRPFSLFVSVGLLKFVPEGYCPRYQHIVLSSPTLARQFDVIKAGGSHTNKLNLGDIPHLEIPLPPLAEQQRVVAKVDTLMALCDSLKAGITDASQIQTRLADAVVERAAA